MTLETAKEALQQVTNSPKVAATISTATTAVGTAAASELIHGLLVDISMFIGIIVTVLLGIVHWRRGQLLKKQIENLENGKPIGGEHE